MLADDSWGSLPFVYWEWSSAILICGISYYPKSRKGWQLVYCTLRRDRRLSKSSRDRQTVRTYPGSNIKKDMEKLVDTLCMFHIYMLVYRMVTWVERVWISHNTSQPTVENSPWMHSAWTTEFCHVSAYTYYKCVSVFVVYIFHICISRRTYMSCVHNYACIYIYTHYTHL